MKKNLLLLIFLSISSYANAQSVQAFNWVPWKKISPATISALKKITYGKQKTAYNYALEAIKMDCDVEVAVLDMDQDGKLEYAITQSGSFCCGSHGCALTVYKDDGRKIINLIDYTEAVKPAKNGVISSKGVLIRFEINR